MVLLLNPLPLTANIIKAVIQELGWEIIPHPPYSPDLASSDLHLFRCLSNNPRQIFFNDGIELQNWLAEFFSSNT